MAVRDAVRSDAGQSKSDDRLHPSRPAVELRARDGLANFFAKAKAGEKAHCRVFRRQHHGGEGWRPQTTAWLKQRYPKAEFVEVNAAIGGTGSDLGVYRLGRDVLAQKPDLVFVEFAVNDGGAAPEQIYRCMEGIVRQIRRADPSTEICFVYTMHEGMLRDLAAGRLPRSASAMEFIADHYGIPSIHLAQEACQADQCRGMGLHLAQAGGSCRSRPRAFPLVRRSLADSCHPFAETGHKLYTEAIVRSFESMESLGTPGPRPLPTPFTPDNHEAAKLVPLTARHAGRRLGEARSTGRSDCQELLSTAAGTMACGQTRLHVDLRVPWPCSGRLRPARSRRRRIGGDRGRAAGQTNPAVRRILHLSPPGHNGPVVGDGGRRSHGDRPTDRESLSTRRRSSAATRTRSTIRPVMSRCGGTPGLC